MKQYDSHLHSSFSTDSDTAPRAQIEKAIELGLSGMTFTDHMDPEFPLDPTEYIFDTDEYFRTLSALRDEYRDRIDIRIGVEIGLRIDQKALLPAIAAEHPYDFIIGSIHVVDGYDPYYPEYWNDKGTEGGLARFFEATAECVEAYDFFDTFGHIDYIYRYAPADKVNFPIQHFMPLVDRILKALIAKDKALEINTAGWKYGLGYPHPQPAILQRYYELGGRKLTLGSDGHKTEHLAFGFRQVGSYLKLFGFDHYIRYENRQPQIIPVDARPYALAVFDMDGTILDTLDDLHTAVNHSLEAFGFPLRSREEVRAFVGNGIPKLIERAVPAGTDEATRQSVFEHFIPWYKEHCADQTKEYDGITELLKALRAAGIHTAVVSNKADAAVKILAEQYFPGLFEVAIGDRVGYEKKPAPDSVFEVLQQLQIPADQAVYIGDSDVDVATARNAGLDCLAVTWGFRSRAFLYEQGARITVDHPTELAKILL